MEKDFSEAWEWGLVPYTRDNPPPKRFLQQPLEDGQELASKWVLDRAEPDEVEPDPESFLPTPYIVNALLLTRPVRSTRFPPCHKFSGPCSLPKARAYVGCSFGGATAQEEAKKVRGESLGQASGQEHGPEGAQTSGTSKPQMKLLGLFPREAPALPL